MVNKAVRIIKIFVTFLGAVFFLLFPQGVALAAGATLSLSPSTGTFNKGCSFSVDVVLNTGGVKTAGSEAIILYDTALFTVTAVKEGGIYPDFPGKDFESQPGRVSLSGISTADSPFSGQGVLATIKFTVKDDAREGAAQIKFDFDPNNKSDTTDSNVASVDANEILDQVQNGSYTVGSGSCVSPSPSPGAVKVGAPTSPQPSPTPQIPTKQLPEAGVTDFLIPAALGLGLLILGMLGLALL